MRRCILRMNDVIRYERLPLAVLLARMDLRATREQRELTRLLHLCGERMENSANPQLVELFVREAGLGGRGWRNSFGFFPRRTGAYISGRRACAGTRPDARR